MSKCRFQLFGRCIPLFAIMFLSILVSSSILVMYYGVSLPQMALLSVSKIYVEPTGWEDPSTHEWKGSYWVVLATTSTRETVSFYQFEYQFDKSETEKYYADNEINGKKLVPQATIKITITALQPYWQANLKKVPYTVFPKTYAMGMNKILRQPYKISDVYVDAFTVQTWELNGAWEHHSPFKIKIEKEGKEDSWVMEKTVDLVGTASTVPIVFSKNGETLQLQLQGQLETGYGQPTWSDLVIFSDKHIFVGSEKLRSVIRYDKDDLSYSNYWFGGGNYYVAHRDPDTGTYYPNANWKVLRWKDEPKSPAHYFLDEFDILPTLQIVYPVWGDEFPGVYRSDTLTDYIVHPVKPKDAFTVGVSTTPSAKSLVQYLAEPPCSFTKVDLNRLWNRGYEITQDNKLKIWQPVGSVSWLYTLKISTELADTVVYQPAAGKGEITSIKWATSGTTSASIGDKDMALVSVKQLSTEESRLTVVPSAPSNIPIKITPTSDSKIIAPNDEKIFTFQVENLGTSEEVKGEIIFAVMNDLGTVTDKKSLNYILTPISVQETILTVYTVDAETKVKVSGISVSIQYGISSQQKVTAGGSAVFSLGGYQGNVQLATLETSQYESVSKSISVSSGQNTMFLELPPRGAAIPPWLQWLQENWMIVAMIAILSVVVMTGITMMRTALVKKT